MKPDPKPSGHFRFIILFVFVVIALFSSGLAAAQTNYIQNGDFSNGLQNWVPFIANPPGPVNTISVVQDAGNPVLQMAVNALDGGGAADWHVQTWQTDGPLNTLASSTTYTLSFRAKASVGRTMKLELYQWEYQVIDYRYLGLRVVPTIGTSWQNYSINFRTEPSIPTVSVKLALAVGNQLGTVWVDDIILTAAPAKIFAGGDLQLSSFDFGETWLNRAIQNTPTSPDVVPSDTAHVHEGTAALKLAAGASGMAYAERQANLDLSANNWEMTYWAYVENPSNVANVTVTLRSGLDTQTILKWWPQTGLAAGWNQVVIPKVQFYGQFWRDSGFSWSEPWIVGIKLETNDNGPANVWIDDLRVQPPAGDRKAPAISSVNLESLSATTVTVSWKTDESATGRLDCGTTTGYGLSQSNSTPTLSHSLSLSSLAANSLYHCQVSSDDSGPRTGRSGDFVFRTDPLTPWVPIDPAGKFQVGLVGVPGWDDTGAFTLASLDEPLLTRFSHFYGPVMTWESDAQILQYLDKIALTGRRAFVSIDNFAIEGGQLATIQARVNAIKGHAAVAGWYLYDEPEFYSVTPQQMQDAYNAIKAVDSVHPITFAAPGFGPAYPFLGSLDYGILDPYPIPVAPPDDILTNLAQAAQAGKPYDFVVQAYQSNVYGNWPGDGPTRFPSRDETRSLAYLALNHGSGNIIFYGYFESHIAPGVTWEWMKANDLGNELIRLGPIYSSTDVPQVTFQSADNANLDVGVKQWQGKVYATVVNRSASPVSGTLTFAGQSILSTAEVVTQRLVTSTGTTLTDNWTGYGVNIYEMNTVVPAAPSGLSGTAISPTQVSLTWTDNANNEDGFKVRRATSAGGPFTELSPAPGPNVTTFADTTASEGTQYWYRVTAYRTIATESAIAGTGPIGTPPKAPTGLSTNPSSNLVGLTWTDNSTVETGFSVERATSSGGPYAPVGNPPAKAGTGTTTFNDTNAVVDGTQYWYRVAAVKTGFPNSTYAGPASALTPIKAPTSFNATAQAGRVNRLTWTDTSASEAGFEVQRAVKSGNTCGTYTLIATPPASGGTGATVTYNDAGSGGNPPLAGTTYCYRVRSTNALSQSAWVGPQSVKTKN